MQKKLGTFWFSITIITLIINGLFVPPVMPQNKQEVVVTIDKIEQNFNYGEELRKQMKFNEAIEEYQMVLTSGESPEKEAEALYNVGLCYTWLFELDKAEAVFYEVIKTYPDNGQAVGYSEFCLAWIDVQRRNYNNAIERLEQTLEKNINDMELNAKVQFEIGRIYSLYLLDYGRAREAFQKVMALYPNSSTAEHPWLKNQ